MADFSEILINSFDELISRFGLIVRIVSENEVCLIKPHDYVLQVTKAPNGEIDFIYYVNQNNSVVSFHPLRFIVTRRQGLIPRDTLTKNPVGAVDNLDNYRKILIAAGPDILVGNGEWLTDAEGSDVVSELDAARVSQMLRA